MKIDKIQSYVTPKTTGYASAIGIGMTVASGVTKNKSMKAAHKMFAFISAFLTVLHIGLIEFYHYKFKNK